jgi:site-specific DNA recombinase
MLKAALYARYSTDGQSAASVEDQLSGCRKLADQLGASVVAEFSDAAISGQATANRTGFLDLMNFARAGGCDLVLAEHSNRLSRGGSDGWRVFEDLEDLGVAYRTVLEGEVTYMHQGLSSLMSVGKIKEVSAQTRRGLEGVVRSGRSAGGMAYGYRSPLAYDASGERIRGLREIDEAQAAVVRRIFTDYAAGASPLSVTDALNREGVSGPRGGPWVVSTVIGCPKRKLGMLRNEIYRGVRVWGKLKMVKDRRTGRRRAAPGTGSVQRLDVPELRIVSDELWAKVERQMALTSIGPQGEGSGQRRPQKLLSGLIRCPCGAPMTSAGTGGYLRCTVRTSRGHGACQNARNPAYARIEAKVLEGIEANLLHPVSIAEAVKAFRKALVEDRSKAGARREPLERELADVTRRADRLVREVEDGMPWSAVKARHAQLLARQADLHKALEAAPVGAEVVRLHTGGAEPYRVFVDALRRNLTEFDGPEAMAAVRTLVEEVNFIPGAKKGEFDLEVVANLAPVLGLEHTGSGTHASAGNTVTFQSPARVTVKFRVAG